MGRIAIKHPDDPTRPTVIPESQYRPEVHELWDAPQEVEEVEEVAPPGLPDDFPGRKHLEAAGLDTLHAVRACQDFDEITGIGQVTEEEIVAYLADLEAQEE